MPMGPEKDKGGLQRQVARTLRARGGAQFTKSEEEAVTKRTLSAQAQEQGAVGRGKALSGRGLSGGISGGISARRGGNPVLRRFRR